MNSYRYPTKALAADYIRSAIGVLLPIYLMLITDLIPIIFYSMVALMLLFAGYGLRTALRHATVLTVDGIGVRQEGPLGGLVDNEIRWSEMREFRLRYYSTRRDRTGGWMQLVLRGAANGSAIHMDSNLPGLDDVVSRAHAAAQDNGLDIDPATAANLSSFGLGGGDLDPATMDAKPRS
ncbi:MAG: hypothetical protein HOC72_11250 [Rhodospirillaceae bacterium]|jgi:hypothetical protein|nr:hypothetical protein [Rhodospirillaceae bacterium]